MRGWILCFLCAAHLQAAELRIGTGAVRITPPPGAPMAGYYYHRGAEGVHDDLWAKALVIEADGQRAALVACDLIGLPGAIVEEARRILEKDPGIPPAFAMFSATHAHTGPLLVQDRMTRAPEGEMLRLATAYSRELPEKLAECVRLAAARMQPARLSAGRGRQEDLAFNRRFLMKDGSVGWNPGKGNPNAVRPIGPTDPEVPVVLLESPDGKPLAGCVNFALHLDTVGGTHYSADYPFTLSRLLQESLGDGFFTLFTIGCAGNLNHIDIRWARPQKGNTEAARIGTLLAAEVLRAWKKAEPLEAAVLKAARSTVSLPLAEIRPEELAWARQVTPKFGKPGAAPFLDLVRAFRITEIDDRRGRPVDAEVQAIALGPDIAWLGLPGEIFTELGLAIKAASPFRFTLISELTNDSIGYVPNRKAYEEGAYEVVSSRLAPGAGEMLADAAVRLLVDLHSTAAPERKP